MTPLRRSSAALLAAFALPSAITARAEPAAAPPEAVAVVLSSELPAYREAWEGFREELGAGATVQVLADRPPVLPAGVRVVVAFGGKAASAQYPRRAFLLYSLSPGIGKVPHPGAVPLRMLPRPERLAEELVSIQPGLQSLAVLWVSRGFAAYIRALGPALRARGVILRARRLAGDQELPEALRSLGEEAEALWLPPDPLLINPASFVTLSAFSRGRGLALHSSLPGLVEKGASTSIAPGYREIGRSAARAVRGILAGEAPPAEIFPESCETIVRRGAGALGISRPGGAP